MQQFLTDSETQLEYLHVDNNRDKVVIVLHGYGASMYDLFPLHEYIENSAQFDWYFPNAPISLMPGSLMGRAWFPIDEQALQRAMMTGEQRQFAAVYPPEMDDALEKMKKFLQNHIKDKQVILCGFSQGSMMCTHLLAAGDFNYSHGVFFSGTLIGKKQLFEANHPKKIDFLQSHGHEDPVLEYAQAKDLFEALKLSGHQGEFVSFSGGHEIPMNVIEKWRKFMLKI